MGVWMRSFEPGFAGTHRHFHEVEEEWAYVLSGSGVVRIGPLRIDVRAGHFVGFPPGPRPHHFVAGGTEPMVLLEGGERRPDEDSGCYVDIGRRWLPGRKFVDAAEPPPAEEGDPGQCVHVDDLAIVDYQHSVDAGARRVMRSLRRSTGLVRQAVRWTRVAVGDRSTAYHTHDRTDEWVYILEGRAHVRSGEDHFEVSAGNFVGHPAGGPAHVMEPISELTYLMGGQIDPDDVVIYPEAGVQRRRGRTEPLASP
jgi:uncharacterized cupin superfamily protein